MIITLILMTAMLILIMILMDFPKPLSSPKAKVKFSKLEAEGNINFDVLTSE